ncbi:MAG: ATP-binding protein [Devosiaceae bacterium]
MIGAVSHEMRNPLNGILGMAHLLGETKLDASQRNYLDGIATSGDVLLTLVNDLLDLTALQAGAVSINPAPTDIVQLINQCLELAAPRAHAKGLALGSTVDPQLGGTGSKPLLMDIDGARLRQVLTNLLSNAIKFTQTGGVRLVARIVQNQSTATLHIEVEDTGYGIAPSEQTMVFQPFGRARSALATGSEGTGLGLPLSRGLAHALGGDLHLLASSLGKGTTMRLVLPLTEGIWNKANAHPLPLTGQRILLALGPNIAATPEADALSETLTALGASTHLVSDAQDLSSPPEDVDHVLVDARFDHAMLWSRLCLPSVGIRPVILVRPDHRHVLPELQEAGFSGYLIRPVRQSSLIAMLTHRFDGAASTDFLPDPADQPTPSITRAPKRVLLADDNAVNALLAKTALVKAGHTVCVASDGAHAVELAKAENFDAALLDLSMPVLDGFEASKALRNMGFTGQLIAYSGSTDPALDEKIKLAGFDSFAQKPVSPDALQALIEQD